MDTSESLNCFHSHLRLIFIFCICNSRALVGLSNIPDAHMHGIGNCIWHMVIHSVGTCNSGGDVWFTRTQQELVYSWPAMGSNRQRDKGRWEMRGGRNMQYIRALMLQSMCLGTLCWSFIYLIYTFMGRRSIIHLFICLFIYLFSGFCPFYLCSMRLQNQWISSCTAVIAKTVHRIMTDLHANISNERIGTNCVGPLFVWTFCYSGSSQLTENVCAHSHLHSIFSFPSVVACADTHHPHTTHMCNYYCFFVVADAKLFRNECCRRRFSLKIGYAIRM